MFTSCIYCKKPVPYFTILVLYRNEKNFIYRLLKVGRELKDEYIYICAYWHIHLRIISVMFSLCTYLAFRLIAGYTYVKHDRVSLGNLLNKTLISNFYE